MAENIPIYIQLETGQAEQNVGNIKKAIKELQTEALKAGDTQSEAYIKAAQKAGRLKDSLEDIADATKSFKGDPLEGLSRGFGTLKGKLTDLDFQGFNDEVSRMSKLSKQVTFKQLAGSVGETSKSFLQLGKILLTNPIFLIGTVIATVIANFDKLRTAGGFIGKMFSAIGDAIGFVVQKLKDFADWIGATDFAGQEKADKTIENANREAQAIESRYNREISAAQAAGQEIDRLELDKQAALRATYQQEIDAIRYKAKSQRELTKEQQDRLDELNNMLLDSAQITQNIFIKTSRETSEMIAKNTEESNNKIIASSKAASDKIKENRKEVDDFLENAKEQRERSRRTELENELLDIDKQFTELREKAAGNNKRLEELDTENFIAIQNARVNYLKKQLELGTEMTQEQYDIFSQIGDDMADYEIYKEDERFKEIFKAREDFNKILLKALKEANSKTFEAERKKLEELQDLEEQFFQRNLELYGDEYDKQEQQVNEKYDKLFAANQQYFDKLVEYKKKSYFLPQAEIEKRVLEVKQQAADEEKKLLEKQQEELSKIGKNRREKEIKEEQKYFLERLAIAKNGLNSISDLVQETSSGFENLGSDILGLAARTGSALTDIFKKFSEGNLSMTDKFLVGLQAANNLLGEIGNIVIGQGQRRLEQIAQLESNEVALAENTRDVNIRTLDEQLAQGLITQEQYDSQAEQIQYEFELAKFNSEEKFRKDTFDAQKKTFEQEKKIRIGQALMQGAQAAIAAYTAGASVPLVGPVTTGPAFAAIAGAFTAAQVALIASQKFGGSYIPGVAPSPPTSTSGSSDFLYKDSNNVKSNMKSSQMDPSIFFGLGQGIFKNTAAGQDQIKVYVTEGDISGVQNKVSVIQNRSIIR